uniref:Uncharacterized protein n=1 Tax=Solanum tuberosum TaxID=4113 RepID=M1DZS1_SOLTU
MRQKRRRLPRWTLPQLLIFRHYLQRQYCLLWPLGLQAALLRMRHLTHSTDRRASRLEATILGMIQTALADVVTPLSSTIDALAVRIVVRKCGQGGIEEVTALKVVIVELRRDVDKLKSTDMCQKYLRLPPKMIIELKRVLSAEGENQVDERKEQLADRRTISRCSIKSPKVKELEEAEGQDKNAMKLANRRITEFVGEPDLLRRMALHSIF